MAQNTVTWEYHDRLSELVSKTRSAWVNAGELYSAGVISETEWRDTMAMLETSERDLIARMNAISDALGS